MRISELGMQQLLLQGFQKAQESGLAHQAQLSSGKKYQTYGEYGADSLRLLSAKGVMTRSGAYQNASQIAETRLELQGENMTTISDAVDALRADFTTVLSTGSSEVLPSELETAAQRILTALNAQFGGTYLFGGTDGSTAPVDATSLSDLADAASINDLFTEGGRATLAVEEGVSIDGGPLASDIASDLLSELQDLANAESTLGPFDGELTDAQRSYIVEKNARLGEIADNLSQELGLNAAAQGQASDAAARNQQKADLAELVASDIENVDPAEAITRLYQDQFAIQASAQALSQATQLSLLNYI